MAKAPSSKSSPRLLDLDRSVPVLVTILANKITSTGSSTFRERHGIGSTEWKVLSSIAIEPHTTGLGIAQCIGLDKAAVSRTLKRFVEQGIVKLDRSDRHSNYQNVSLTAKGTRLHDQAVLTAFEREDILLATLSPEERDQLVAILTKLLAAAPALAGHKPQLDPPN